MNSIVCDNIQCKYNGGKFCNKEILIIYSGICGELVDRQGRKKDIGSWRRNNKNTESIINDSWEY